MKWVHTGLVAASVLSLGMVVGCSSTPRSQTEMTKPAITTAATRQNIVAGESVMVTANTVNLVGSNGVRWSVTPSGANLQPQQDTAGQTALFSANQPGTYVVRAEAQGADGRTASSETTITVSGRMRNTASER